MSPELDKKLCDKYPKLLKQRNQPGTYMSFGVMCDDGWFFLLDKLFGHIKSYAKYNLENSKVEIAGVKEKFSTLRIFVDGGDDRIQGMVSHTEYLSAFVCETCGTTKNVGQTHKGWLKTICLDCINKCGDKEESGWRLNE
ncbi:MAG: hypothetical protein Q8O88_02175 [bacterium]|nr:hypothetical protein [bacterium]